MDYEKQFKEFEGKGHSINIECIEDSRKGLLVLDTENASDFLERIIADKSSTMDLKKSLLENKNDLDDDWKYDYRPSLYVDFLGGYFRKTRDDYTNQIEQEIIKILKDENLKYYNWYEPEQLRENQVVIFKKR